MLQLVSTNYCLNEEKKKLNMAPSHLNKFLGGWVDRAHRDANCRGKIHGNKNECNLFVSVTNSHSLDLQNKMSQSSSYFSKDSEFSKSLSSSSQFLFNLSTEKNKYSDILSNRVVENPVKPHVSRQSFTLKEVNSDSPELTPVSNETILSVYWKRGKLGAAYYTISEGELYLLNDVTDIHPDFKNLKCLLNQVQSSNIVTCSKLSDSFMKTLSELVSEEDSSCNGRNFYADGKLIVMPGNKNDLNYDSCRRLILGRRFTFEPSFADEEESLLFKNTYIDFKCESMVMSLGILLKYLDKYIPQRNLSHQAPCINVIQQVSLERLVSVDEVSYRTLQIFNTQHHPSAFKKNNCGSSREGLSIFSIFSRCKSRIGTKKMRQLFMNPIKDIRVINSRLDTIQFCMKPKHEHIVKNLTECIKKVDSVTGILTSMYRSRSSINHWKSLYSSLYNAILIGQICSSYSSHSEIFMKMAKSITKEIHEVAHYINHVVDFEESNLRSKFSVRAGIDSKLDKMRETYAQVPDVLIKVAELELKELPECIGQCSVVYIMELGYLLSVPIWKGDGSNVADYKIQNFQAKFIANQCVHYKTPRCTELDNVLGDMLAGMCTIESNIMIALMEFIHERVPDIIRVVNCVAELDCMIAMADTALENNYTRPVLTTERVLDIIKGRHPVLELCVENFVPNDANFSKENAAIQILTGPNASGKSIYLKQTAIIAFLAHLGSFVPAQRAVVGVLDHIHCLTHVSEGVSTRLSSFVSDLKHMSRALYCSTPSTLILIDEFGTGTTEIDGLSLLAASLIHFAERKENCPFIIVSTHFHSLAKLLPQTPIINSLHMDYIIENGEIVYVHRIKTGTCHSSLAYLAATKAGLGEKSVQRFLQVLSRDGKPINCNFDLEIGKTMLREVKFMKEFLGTDTKDKSETVPPDEN